MNIKMRLRLLVGLLSVLMLFVGGLGLYGLGKASDSLKTVYEDRAVPMGQLAEIQQLLLSSQLSLATQTNIVAEQYSSAALADNLMQIEKIWKEYKSTYLTPEESKLADSFSENYLQLRTNGIDAVVAALNSADKLAASKLLNEQVMVLSQKVQKDLTSLLNLQMSVAKQEFGLAEDRYHFNKIVFVLLILIGGAFAIGLGMTVTNTLIQSISVAQTALVKVAGGDYNHNIQIRHQDELGNLLLTIKNMQKQLGDRVEADQRVANENLRIKIALDNVSTGVMIADTERKIIYANAAVKKLLSAAEQDIRKQLPNFSVANLMGTNIDSFHKAPAHQAQLLANLKSVYQASMQVGGHAMVVTANPVISSSGERLGAVAEWQDRSEEVATEEEVAAVVSAAVNGDFSQRLSLHGKHGFFKQLSESINQLMVTSEAGLEDVARILSSLSRGDLTAQITNEYLGTFARLKDDSNATVGKLKEIVEQIKEASDAINTAAKEISSGNSDLSQRTEEQASSLEETASSMEELTSTVKQNAENAKQANQLAKGASDVASKGGVAVKQVVATMDSINESSRKIVDIISVIDGIAFQTNILALNAAVEAARAGEQGRGFAVVAGEVRNLAQRSASAAKEIKELISDSVQKVEGGSKQVASAGQTMEQIVTAISRVTDIVSEITSSSVEQSNGIDQVSQAVTQMDEVTQQNAALVEEAAAAAFSLEEQAQSLVTMVAAFRVEDRRVMHKRDVSAAFENIAEKPVQPKPHQDDEWADF